MSVSELNKLPRGVAIVDGEIDLYALFGIEELLT